MHVEHNNWLFMPHDQQGAVSIACQPANPGHCAVKTTNWAIMVDDMTFLPIAAPQIQLTAIGGVPAKQQICFKAAVSSSKTAPPACCATYEGAFTGAQRLPKVCSTDRLCDCNSHS
jgi:hypothetical protein